MADQLKDPLPKREGSGLRNLDLFIAGSRSSPVCFYFEDEGCEELYTRLLSRLFPKYEKPLVVCTGGKTKKSVLDSAKTHALSPVVYVQDKDFDDIVGAISTDPRVVTLHRYSFENYLLEPEALAELAIEGRRRLRKDDAVAALDLENYFDDLYEKFQPLTALYVIAQRLNLRSIKSTKQSVSDLFGEGATNVPEAALERYKNKVLAAALASQRIGTEEEFTEFWLEAIAPKPQYADHADQHPNSHFCGKQLLDLTLAHIDSMVQTGLSKLERFEVTMRLVLHVSLAVFNRVKQSIVDALRRQNTSDEVMAMFA
jgi:hypothetical protein